MADLEKYSMLQLYVRQQIIHLILSTQNKNTGTNPLFSLTVIESCTIVTRVVFDIFKKKSTKKVGL